MPSTRIKVAANPVRPAFYWNISEPLGTAWTEQVTGYESYFLEYLIEKFNLTIEIIFANKTVCGETDEGDLKGICALIKDEIADWGVGDVSIGEKISKYVDFTYPHDYDYVTFISRKIHGTTQRNSVLDPFTSSLWCYLVLAIVLVGIWFKMFLLKGKTKAHEPWWLLFSSIVNQAEPNLPKRPSAKIFMPFWWFSFLLLTMVYQASFRSSLGVQEAPLKLRTLDDVSEAIHDNKIILKKMPLFETYANFEPNGRTRESYIRLQARSEYCKYEDIFLQDCFKDAFDHKSDHITVILGLKTHLLVYAGLQGYGQDELNLPVNSFGASMATEMSGMAISKDNNRTSKINSILFAFGMFDAWKTKAMHQNKAKKSIDPYQAPKHELNGYFAGMDFTYDPMPLDLFMSAFIVYCSGICFALIALFFELHIKTVWKIFFWALGHDFHGILHLIFHVPTEEENEIEMRREFKLRDTIQHISRRQKTFDFLLNINRDSGKRMIKSAKI